MNVFFKCSFKSSRGFRIGAYDPTDGSLSFISEKDAVIRERMSRETAKLLQIQLGQSMVLAADEKGRLFTGILGLEEDGYEKYVNAIFVGEKPEEALGVFRYFCRCYHPAASLLLECIFRDPAPGGELEFGVDKRQMRYLLDQAKRQVKPGAMRETGGVPLPKALEMPRVQDLRSPCFQAFVTCDTYADYRLGLSEIFPHPPKVCYEKINVKNWSIPLKKRFQWG